MIKSYKKGEFPYPQITKRADDFPWRQPSVSALPGPRTWSCCMCWKDWTWTSSTLGGTVVPSCLARVRPESAMMSLKSPKAKANDFLFAWMMWLTTIAAFDRDMFFIVFRRCLHPKNMNSSEKMTGMMIQQLASQPTYPRLRWNSDLYGTDS